MTGARPRGPDRRWAAILAGAALVVAGSTAAIVHVTVGAASAAPTSLPPGPVAEASSTTTAPPTIPPTTVAPTTLPPTTVAPTTVAPTPVPALGVLDDPRVTAFLATRPGTVTAAVYDFTSGQESLYRPGVGLATASIVKVGILGTLLAQAQSRGLTVAEQARATAMIEQSDNDAATALWDAVSGAAGVDAFDRAIGLTTTSPGADGYWGLTTTTASDQIAVLRALARPNGVLTDLSRAYALGLMAGVEPDQHWGVSAGVASGTSVFLKNGWLPDTTGWHVNSIGLVSGQGRDYAIAVLTAGNASEDAGIATIEGLSSLVWQLSAH